MANKNKYLKQGNGNNAHPSNANTLKIGAAVLACCLLVISLGIINTPKVEGQSATPTSVNFATPQLVGTPSPSQSITFFPPAGGGITTIVGIAVSGDFATATGGSCTAGGVVSAGGCTINIVFNPTAAGARTGTLTVTSQQNLYGTVTPLTPVTINLSGTGVAPTPTATATATPTNTPTITPTNTPTITPTATFTQIPATPTFSPIPNKPTQSAIGGTIRLDGKPLTTNNLRIKNLQGLFSVKLDPTGATAAPDNNGFYNFTGLAAGAYVVRVQYDPTKVQPVNGRDFSNQTVDGKSVERAIDFDFVSIAQAQPVTVSPAVPTSTATVVTATAVPVTTTAATKVTPQCPPQVPGNNLQIAMQVTPVDNNFSYLCIRVTQGTNLTINADLSHTIDLNAPAAILESLPSAGTVSVNVNNAVWNVGILNPGSTATLIVGVGTAAANLSNSSTVVTGIFSTGEAFRRVIGGVVALTEIVPTLPYPPVQSGNSNLPRATPAVPSNLPNTGKANTVSDNPVWLSLTMLVALSVGGLVSYIIWKARLKKARRR